MATEIEMPKLGLSMQEGKITKWLHQEGDQIKKGEAILEISTDKISNVVESPIDGVLLKIYYSEGEVVPVHQTIAVVGQPDENIETNDREEKSASQKDQEVQSTKTADKPKQVKKTSAQIDDIEQKVSPVAKKYADRAGVKLSEVKGTGPKNRIMKKDVKSYLKENKQNLPEEELKDYGTQDISPIAHKMADEYGINIENIKGSGPKNRILKNDVLNYIENNKLEKQNIKTESQKISFDNVSPVAQKLCQESNINPENITGTGPGGRVMKSDVERHINSKDAVTNQQLSSKREKLTERRQIIADKMKESRKKAAHADVSIDIEMSKFMDFYHKLSSQLTTKLNLNALFIKAVTEVVKKYPIINARLEDREVIYHGDVNVGLAVDSNQGLLVPVIKNTEDKGINQLSEEINLIINKAKRNELNMDELKGGTITISNLGMYNTKSLTPIINYPEVAIFGIGTIQEKPLVKEGGIFVGKIVNITLSFDHRLIDGALAAKALNTLKTKLENPEDLI